MGAVVTRVVTTAYRYKRPAKKRKAVAIVGPAVVTKATSPRPANDDAPAKPATGAAKPAIATSTSRKRARLQRAEQATEPDDDPEADAAMRAWLERAKWVTGQRADASDGSREGKRDATTAATGTATDQRDGLSARNPRSVPRS